MLANAAARVDHDRFAVTAAFVRPDKTHLVSVLEGRGVRCVLVPGYEQRQIGWIPRVRTLIRGFQIVHAHSPLIAGVVRLAALTLPRRERPVVVSTEHNLWSGFALPTRLINALTCGLDAKRWAVSQEVKTSVWPALRPSYEVLLHGTLLGDPLPADTRAEVREELGLAETDLVGITVANYRRQKNYPNLLAAVARVRATHPGFVMLVVGQGPLADEVAATHASLGLGDGCRLLGYRDDVRRLLAAADLFILGSDYEGLPVAVMEAMAAGLPIVATAVGGVPEAVTDGESGLLVPPRDPEALAAAIGRLVEDPALCARLAEGSARTSPRFDIATAVQRQQEVYAALATAQGRRPAALATDTNAP